MVAKDAAAAVAQKPHFWALLCFGAMAMGHKPRSREHEKVQRAAHHQKGREGKTPNGAPLKAAERRASRRAAKNPVKLGRVQDTMGSADVSAQKHLENWQDPEIPVAELEDVYDPAFARCFATHTASLRGDADIDRFAVRAEESSAGAAANVVSRRTRAALRKEGGFSKTYRSHRGGQQKIVRAGAQVRAQEKRDRKLRALPPQLRPTFKTQTSAPGANPSLKFGGAGKSRVVKRTHARGPPAKRSRAEISAQALRVTGPDSRGRYRMKIPKSLWSDGDLARMGFRPRAKPKRAFDFNGPTAEDDARAFDKTMMEWLKNPNRVGPPPQP